MLRRRRSAAATAALSFSTYLPLYLSCRFVLFAVAAAAASAGSLVKFIYHGPQLTQLAFGTCKMLQNV